MRWGLALGAALITLASPFAVARASDRQFAYTYGSSVLGPDEVEFEPWTTARLGRAEFYRRFDERLEFEAGLSERLQTSLYLNFSATGQGPAAARSSAFEFEGISSEWKFKLTDPVAHPLGSALYAEVTMNALEADLEGKLILDKRVGPFLAALNLVGEREWSLEHATAAQETAVEVDAAFAWLVRHNLSLGLEARSVNVLGPAGRSVLFAGPALSYSTKAWWAALAFQPQLIALRGATNGRLNLEDQERLEARLLLGFHL